MPSWLDSEAHYHSLLYTRFKPKNSIVTSELAIVLSWRFLGVKFWEHISCMPTVAGGSDCQLKLEVNKSENTDCVERVCDRLPGWLQLRCVQVMMPMKSSVEWASNVPVLTLKELFRWWFLEELPVQKLGPPERHEADNRNRTWFEKH